MLVAGGNIPPLFAEAACTQHALVSTGIKGKEVVAAEAGLKAHRR